MCCRKGSFASVILGSSPTGIVQVGSPSAGSCCPVRSPIPRHANHPQAPVPVALPTMRHGDDHHPQAFVDRALDAVCQFRLIVEQRRSAGPTTRLQHVFPPVCSKCPQSLFMQRGIATRMPSHLPNCRNSAVEYANRPSHHRTPCEEAALKSHKRPPQTPAASF